MMLLFRLALLLALFLSLTAWGDLVRDLSPEAVLPNGASVQNIGTGREPPNALENAGERHEFLDSDGEMSTTIPDGPLGPAQNYEGGGRRAASHDWEGAYDMYSPLLFNWKFYAAKYELGDVTEAQVRADWKAHVEAGDKYPDCRQGQPLFSANKYMENNPVIQTNIEESCGGALRSYITIGVTEGASGETGVMARDDKSATEVKIKRGLEIPSGFFDAAERYTLAFFLNFESAGGGDYRGIIRYGSPEEPYPKSPSVLQYPSTLDEPNTRLTVIVAHTDDPDFSCDPEPHVPVGKWTHVAIAVDTNSVKVYYDGEEVCHAQSDTGTTLVAPDLHMLVGDNFHSAAFAKLDKVTFYKSEVMNGGMLKAVMAIDPPLEPESNDEIALV